MQYPWKRSEMHIKYESEIHRGRDHMGAYSQMGGQLNLKEIRCEGMGWIHPFRTGSSGWLL
jgi:hypothetical protein